MIKATKRLPWAIVNTSRSLQHNFNVSLEGFKTLSIDFFNPSGGHRALGIRGPCTG